MQKPSQERRQRSRVLIVETEETRAREFFQMLSGVPRLEAQVVSGKLPAFERLKSWKPQIILIGDELSGHCGLELTIWLRKYSNVPILVVTEDDSFEYFLQILNSGADGCVYHPVPAPLLTAQIMTLLRRAYRYSRLVERELDEAAQQPPNQRPQSATNTPPLSNASASTPSAAISKPSLENMSMWPTCGMCSYKGPNEKFHFVTPRGEVTMRCPACNSTQQIRHTLR